MSNLEQRMLEAINNTPAIEVNSLLFETIDDYNGYAKVCADIALEDIRKAFIAGVNSEFEYESEIDKKEIEQDANKYLQTLIESYCKCSPEETTGWTDFKCNICGKKINEKK